MQNKETHSIVVDLMEQQKNPIRIFKSVLNEERTNCSVEMPSRRDRHNLTRELNSYLEQKEYEIREKLKNGPPLPDESICKAAPKSLVN